MLRFSLFYASNTDKVNNIRLMNIERDRPEGVADRTPFQNNPRQSPTPSAFPHFLCHSSTAYVIPAKAGIHTSNQPKEENVKHNLPS